MLKVSQLFIYPIKSMGGIEVDSALVTDRGFQYDRRWMLVDENNVFISQREVPQMALMKIKITAAGLEVYHQPKSSTITIPFKPQTEKFTTVFIWDDNCIAQYVGHETDKWFQEMLGIKCRLVFMPDSSFRPTDYKYTPHGHVTSLSDGYPFLVIGQASLDELNSRLPEPLSMNRFRPNIVFTGAEPFAEDQMKELTIGNILFKGVKLCARCPITTIDQGTGERQKEPLKLLSTFRKRDNKVYFGQNLIHEGIGAITRGDELRIIERHDDERFFI